VNSRFHLCNGADRSSRRAEPEVSMLPPWVMNAPCSSVYVGDIYYRVSDEGVGYPTKETHLSAHRTSRPREVANPTEDYHGKSKGSLTLGNKAARSRMERSRVDPW
jgi:hypothetical protein